MSNSDYLNKLHSSIPPDYYEVGVKKNLFQKYWHKKRIKVIKKFFKSLKNNVPVLDLGCHGGWLTNKISKFIGSNNIYGVDISKVAINYAKKRYKNLNFSQQNLEEKILFPDKMFRLITAFDIIEHIPNTTFLLKEISRVLQKNGWFIVGVPTENFLFKIVWWLWLKMRGGVWKETHVHHYKIKELTDLIQKRGFQKIDGIKIHLGMYWLGKFQKL